MTMDSGNDSLIKYILMSMLILVTETFSMHFQTVQTSHWIANSFGSIDPAQNPSSSCPHLTIEEPTSTNSSLDEGPSTGNQVSSKISLFLITYLYLVRSWVSHSFIKAQKRSTIDLPCKSCRFPKCTNFVSGRSFTKPRKK